MELKRIARSLLLSTVILSLQSCFLAPGMKMETPKISKESYEAAREIKISFIPITVNLVRQQQHYAFGRHNHNGIHHYRIGAHDILNIYIWGHPELSPPTGQTPIEQGQNAALTPSVAPVGYLVSPDGSIFFPLIGYVQVGGKSAEEVRRKITHGLKKYVRNPQVDVRISGFRSKKIYVMGEVIKPGLQPITDSPLSITAAINLAGGMILDSADPSHIFVIRGDYGHPDVYWLNAHSPSALLLADHFYLRSGDVLFVSTAGVSRWNRAISQILPTIQTIWFTGSIINAAKN